MGSLGSVCADVLKQGRWLCSLAHTGQLASAQGELTEGMLGRLVELVVVDAQGAVQPLEHVDFGNSELFFSGTHLQGLGAP